MLSNLKVMRRYRHVVKLKRYEKIYDMLSNLDVMRRYRHVVKRYEKI